MLEQPWWERYPERLHDEERALRDAGITFERDDSLAEQGRLTLKLVAPRPEGGTIPLIARFPAFYPYHRFVIEAHTVDLPRHQHPFAKNLCLIGRGSWNWKTSDFLADFIRDRLRLVLAAGADDDAGRVGAIEEHQAEPFSEYYEYHPESMLLIDSSWSIDPGVRGGKLVIGLEAALGRGGFRGAVLKVRDDAGNVLAEAEPAVQERCGRRTIVGRWLRTYGPIRQGTPLAFREELARRDRRFERPVDDEVSQWSVDVIGVLFPEERGWRDGDAGEGWVFTVTYKRARTSRPRSGSGASSVPLARGEPT